MGFPGRNLAFWSFVGDDCSKVLEILHFFYPLTFYLDLSLEVIWVVCHHFCLVWADLHFVPCGGCIERSTRNPVSSSSSAFTTMSSAKQQLVKSCPPMLTLRSWSSKASHMILSRKMLKRVGKGNHPFRTSTVVLNHSHVLPFVQDCTLSIVIQIFNGSYDADVDVVFSDSCP